MKKHSFEDFVARARSLHGDKYEYPDQIFLGYRYPVRIVCREHGPFEQLASNHVAKTGCPSCAELDKSVSQVEFLRRSVLHFPGYDFSESLYRGARKHVSYRCPTHGLVKSIAAHLMTGRSGCPMCGRESVRQSVRNSEDQWLDRAKSVHGDRYAYLSVTWGQEAYIRAVCQEHGEFVQRARLHCRGQGCPECGNEKITGRPGEPLIDAIERAKLLHKGRYEYDLQKSEGRYLAVICKSHGLFKQLISDHTTGHGCRSCLSAGESEAQRELARFCLTLDPTAVTNYRFAGRKELDVFFPSRSIAIEYDGLYWHSEGRAEKLNVVRKHRLANQHGIRVISVFEDEWIHNSAVVKSTIRHALGLSERVYARQCSIHRCDGDQLIRDFLDDHHIQGSHSGTVASFYLTHANRIVMVMTFTRLNSVRGLNEGDVLELRRLASSCSVVGGASRLFRFAMSQLLNISEVISYSDKRMFSGGVYGKMGFSQISSTRPDYYYVKPGHQIRYRKSNFTREKLSKLESFDPGESEAQNMVRMGWSRVYDCGKVKWRWVRT